MSIVKTSSSKDIFDSGIGLGIIILSNDYHYTSRLFVILYYSSSIHVNDLVITRSQQGMMAWNT